MSLAKYEAFLRTVELGSLTAAAETLGYTQSGISHMLQSLEDELGLRLLIRSRSGVTLTDAGERVLPAVRTMLAGREQVTQIVSSLQGLDRGTIRIGTFTSVAVHWLPGIIKQFQSVYPRIEFKLLNGDYYDVEQWLSDGEVDLGFVRLPLAARCRTLPLVEDRLLAILPPDHPLAREQRIPLAAAAREPFISLPESSAQDLLQVFVEAGIRPNIKFTTKDDYALIAMVENGLGISIVPELLLSGRRNRVAVRELETPASRTIALAVRPDQQLGPAAQKFIDAVCSWVAEHAGTRTEPEESGTL